MTYTFGYDFGSVRTAANEALDAWATNGGYMMRYGTVTHGVYVVTDDFDDSAAVMLRWGKGWTWVDELDGRCAEDIHAALCDVGASEPNIEEMLDGAMSCADWLDDRAGTVPRIIGKVRLEVR